MWLPSDRKQALRTQKTDQRCSAATAPSTTKHQAPIDHFIYISLLWGKLSVPITLVALTIQ